MITITKKNKAPRWYAELQQRLAPSVKQLKAVNRQMQRLYQMESSISDRMNDVKNKIPELSPGRVWLHVNKETGARTYYKAVVVYHPGHPRPTLQIKRCRKNGRPYNVYWGGSYKNLEFLAFECTPVPQEKK